MKSLLFAFILFLTSIILSKAEDKYFDQLPTVTDTIRFNNFEYSVDTKYLGIPDIKQNDSETYPKSLELYQNSFHPDWRFECVEKKDNYVIAHFYTRKPSISNIKIYFFDKQYYKLDSVYNFFSVNKKDTKTAKQLSANTNFKAIRNDSIDDQYTHDNVYDHQLINQIYIDEYEAYNVAEDSNFIYFFLLKSLWDSDLNKNIPHFDYMLSTFKFISDSHRFDSTLLQKAKEDFTYNCDLILTAYKEDNEEALEQYLELVRIRRNPIPESIISLKPNYEQEAYKIISRYFYPYYSTEWDDSSYGAKINTCQKQDSLLKAIYFTLEKELEITIVQNIEFKEQYDSSKKQMNYFAWPSNPDISNFTIEDFRPKLKLENAKVIYLNDSLESFLSDFLGKEFLSKDEDKYVTMNIPAGKSRLRERFLRHKTAINTKNSSPEWELGAPTRVVMTFDKDLNTAVMYTKTQCAISELYFKKDKDIWNMFDGKFTWFGD